jgi:ribosomal protein L11
MSEGFSGQTVKLTSSDDKDFEVPVEVASMSVTIKNMLDGTPPRSFLDDGILEFNVPWDR